jgi:hypothetical protein
VVVVVAPMDHRQMGAKQEQNSHEEKAFVT